MIGIRPHEKGTLNQVRGEGRNWGRILQVITWIYTCRGPVAEVSVLCKILCILGMKEKPV